MRKIFILFLISTVSSGAWSQDINDLIKGSLEDANKMVEGYTMPALKAFGYGVNQGWYNTAKPHKKFGVDLTISASAVYIPNSDLFYKVDNSQLNDLELQSVDGVPIDNSGIGEVPTIFGPDRIPNYYVPSSDNTFEGPGGVDLKKEIGIQAMPVPIANLGIGLPKGFDLKVRFVPTLQLGDEAEFNLFGVGVMHDVKQYIPGVKNLPFDLSAFVGYTKMKLTADLDVQAGANQRATFESSAITVQGLISKKISVLTFYGGVGYNIANTKIALLGDYDLDEDGTTDATDPVSIKADANGFRTTVGMRLKLAVFTLHGDYTLQKYNTLTVGFGINVR
ncbi:MAG TPA: hypothetical protein PLM56_06180 [Cyclobacteriaceae bacterium]|nr:hypothetical protein [Cytophagales bacterium]HMR57339.1 hypothetical protein [Cyclobacteriaceae bacterium]HNT50915.1 hypothetical protein [Cyclobacteriaceae bacterium]HRE67327.1 hypothetical protein [Cyclobacteriaceae bacterium]HRF33065.1 hypothetical protein [Cyclobacteriaceae bacterium]